MKNLLQIDIKHLYYKNKTLARDIKLQVGHKERILIVGATGTGKSSLLNTLNMMNQSYEGEILFGGRPLNTYHPHELRTRISMVMQETYLGEGTVQDALDEPLAYCAQKDVDHTDRKERIYQLLEDFKLSPEYLGQKNSQLSGGEKQRIGLIRTLLLRPDILLLDEITSALDQKTSGIISDSIFGTYPGTVIAISHDPLWQERWNRTWRFEGGKLIDNGGVK
ncbi:MAG: ATP-binding cassette domain-containing protein [Candidatus Cloacimonetes bacterium]|jgi:putative ABC transport system ATP-binding protein|nr:ATP-binding cassette domain-containing protein [Candidatus Cloacimonadota bacterium]MDD2423517.1 ATP-binding cassette domain-containing protein [Candidatus Cloacimonadota bacterium]MDD3562600.1 ATP-binding cassette domain-containing protein [Candidatus Cloacimonadota bacterium]MDD4276752.1 ATP-binding cassette domain-containing protein [Candidatus Cloacimonadota bacterium]MDY0326073.1 ATP-binding cassette domain-containing protein [Candidatus Cloacimonadaceae bacterium]